jgi:hypothetical protein
VVLGIKLRPYTLSPFIVMGFFEIGSRELFAWDWLQTVILLISASRVARITGVSHQHPAKQNFFKKFYLGKA